MKFLKLYEELGSEFYEKIHHTVLSNLLIKGGNNTIELDVSDINILDGLKLAYPSIGYDFEYNTRGNTLMFARLISSSFSYFGSSGTIYKIKDDWFLVEVRFNTRYDFKGNLECDGIYYYKCDQIDGLVHLLEDISGCNKFKKVLESSEEVLFTKISNAEWSEKFVLKFDWNYEDFTHSEVKSLTQYFLGDVYDGYFNGWYILGPYGNSLSNYPDYKGLYILNFTYPSKNAGFCIIKFSDEWFYLSDMQKSGNQKFYKCDTFDGLMQCLNHCRL